MNPEKGQGLYSEQIGWEEVQVRTKKERKAHHHSSEKESAALPVMMIPCNVESAKRQACKPVNEKSMSEAKASVCFLNYSSPR